MLPARTIIYAIAISLFLYVLIGAFLALKYQQKILLIQQQASLDLSNLCESGIIYYQTNASDFSVDNTKKINLSEEINETVNITKHRWGAYELVSVNAARNKFRKSVLQLVGSNPADFFTIYLSDQNVFLEAQGTTQLQGRFSLPGGFIKRSKFYGKVRSVDSIKSSPRTIPPISDEFSGFVESIKDINYLSTKFQVEYKVPDFMFERFSDTGVVIFSEDEISLSDVTLSGKIIIRSQKRVSVSPTANLNDIIISAPEIDLQTGFSGSIQLFSDSLIHIGMQCRFKYPSFIGLFANNNASIKIPHGCEIAGGIALEVKNPSPNSESAVILEKGSRNYGLVYSTHNIILKESINGSIYARYTMPYEFGNSKKNVIKDVKINSLSLKDEFTYPVIFMHGRRNNIFTDYASLERSNN